MVHDDQCLFSVGEFIHLRSLRRRRKLRHRAPPAPAPELPVPPGLDLPLSPISNIPLSPAP
jgi:hypothetical protein